MTHVRRVVGLVALAAALAGCESVEVGSRMAKCKAICAPALVQRTSAAECVCAPVVCGEK